MAAKDQIPVSTGPGFKFMKGSSPKPTKPAPHGMGTVPGHSRGKDSKSK
jgi:hypothetical protein